MEGNAKESLPFNNLTQLYDGIANPKPWPAIKQLRECTDYVYKGLERGHDQIQLERLNRDEKPRTLVCHDFKGGYLEDRFFNGSTSHQSYVFYHWNIIDIFVYFSHHFITIPPYGWINAAHNHGVKVLGTVITEHSADETIWSEILKSEESIKKFADALIFVAKFYKFEGWLLNVENTIKEDKIPDLIFFVKYLTENIHKEIEESEIIWYDSVTNKGELKWQNELNEKNKEFFSNCDGIFLNYNWTEAKLASSSILAKTLKRDAKDVYVGLDVWGRGCPGGGGFNSAYALEKIREEGMSCAIFAPGWTYEKFGGSNFQLLEDTFWAQLFPFMYIHVPIYENETFRTSFCQGSGEVYYHPNTELQADPFYNLSKQQPQISVIAPDLKFTHINIPMCNEIKVENKSNGEVQGEDSEETEKDEEKEKPPKKEIECIFENKRNIIKIIGSDINLTEKSQDYNANCLEFYNRLGYEGGGCLKVITRRRDIYHRLFLIHVEFQVPITVHVIYANETLSVENDPNIMLGNDSRTEFITPYRSNNLSKSTLA